MMRQIVLDTETTGLNPRSGDRIIEIGCVELVNRRLTGNNFHYYINPERDSDPGALAVHGLTSEFLSDKPKFADIQPWPELEQSNPFTNMAYGAFDKVTRNAVEKSTAEQMFLSALQLRRAALGGPPAQPAPDPFSSSGTPFAYEATEDGGFILRSEFETRADTPLRYKFGAADAGPK